MRLPPKALLVLLVTGLPGLGCPPPAPPSSEARPPTRPCPDEATLEALHAAAWHLEHEARADEARAALARATGLESSPEARAIADHVREALRLHEAGDAGHRGELELARAAIQDWAACYPEALHEVFHHRLGPSAARR